VCGEVSPGVAFVAEQRLAALAVTAGQQIERDIAFVALGAGQRQAARCAVGCEDRVQSKAPEESAVAGAVAVVCGVPERGSLHCFAAASALDRGRVDKHRSSWAPGLWLAKTPISHSIVSANRRRRLK